MSQLVTVHFKVEVWSILGFPGSTVGKESTCNAGDPGSIPGSGRSAGEGIGYPFQYSLASLVAQLVKNPPAMWEIWVQSLGWEDSLEKGTATYSSILAWRIPWTVYSPWGYEESNKIERLSLSLIKLYFSRFDFSSVIHIIHQFFKWFPSQKCHL